MKPSMIAAAALALLAQAAGAADLMQIWDAARRHDPQGAVAQAARAAGATRREQAAALWRPTLGLSASAGHASADSRMQGAQFATPGMASDQVSFGTSVNGGSATRWALGAKLPLYAPERRAQSRQLEIAADAAETEWQAAQQDWMLQVAQRYFDLVLAQRRLALLEQQQAAVDRAGQEARDRYRIGDAPVTDTHEAEARSSALQAQRIAAQNELELARVALSDSTGIAPAELQLQPPAAGAGTAQAAALDQTLAEVARDNPMLKLLRAQLDVARAEADKHGVAGSASVDLVAQAARERISGSGDFGRASNTQSQQMVGIALNVPLYTGGWRSARLEESLRLAEKANAELERAKLQTAQAARSAWLALDSGQARIAALEGGLVASRARLDATRLGRQVGDRTTLDLLNAENDASAAELALLQARAERLLNRLRIDALAGKLGDESLQSVNAALQR